MENYNAVMGHREKLVSGDEYDALTRGRSFYSYKAGTVKAIKRKFNKRVRRKAKRGYDDV